MKRESCGQAAAVFTAVLFIFFSFISGTAGISEPETAVLADFGATAAANIFGVTGWETVLKDRYTDYRAAGPGGTAITVGSEGGYNYQGVSGAVMFFAAGDRITAVWYSNSDAALTFTPKISFDDPDRSCMGAAGTWHNMSAVTVPGRSTGESIFEFDAASAGAYGLVNISVNYSNAGVLICDKILLTAVPHEPDTEAPSAPDRVFAEPVSESQIRLFWDAARDNIGVAGYRIYSGDGSEKGTSVNTEYRAGGLEPETEYTHTVTAYDAAGNESAHSEPVSASTLPAPDFTVLADFGGTAAANIFGATGWETVLKDRYTDYRASGPGGTVITVGSEGTYNYQGVSGAVMSFLPGDRITAVWYSNSDAALTFTPKISFDDPDRSCMGTAGTWHDMNSVTVPGRGTEESIFEFDAARAGDYCLANVSVNYSNTGVLICDKILLTQAVTEPDTEAPSVPAGVIAEPVSASEIRISWQPSSDDRGVSVYEIFRDGVSVGSAAETSYTDTGLSPLTGYAYTVSACDGAGNCSEQSAAVTVATFGEISVSEAFAETCDDDAYETSDGSVSLTDSVLTLGGDGAAGIRFSGIDIPRGAVITDAYIEFEAGSFQTPPLVPKPRLGNKRTFPSWGLGTRGSRGLGTRGSAEPRIAAADPSELPAQFAVSVEDSDSAAPFLSESHNISGRSAAASAEWEETRLWAAGEKYRTADIAPPVRAIVNRNGWVRGNAAVFVITGTGGLRYAVSCDGGTGAVLHTEYYLLPDTEPPSVPAGLGAEPASASEILVSWEPSSDDRGVNVYEIFRDGVQIGTAGETYYHDTGLSPLTEYAYTVRACDTAGNCSEQSTPVSVTAPGAAEPPEIAFSASALSVMPGGSVTLTWSVSGADSCSIVPALGQETGMSGSVTVSPTETAVWTLEASGPGGTASASVTVRVRNTNLKVTDVDASGIQSDGQTLRMTGTVKVTIVSDGAAVGDSFDVTIFEDTDAGGTYGTPADRVLGKTAVTDGMGSGETKEIFFEVNSEMLFSDNRISAFADSSDAVPESSETDNISHSMAHCRFTPPAGTFKPVPEWEWKKADVMSAPIVADMNNDSIPDIVFVSYSSPLWWKGGTLRAVSGDSGRDLFGAEDPKYYIKPCTNPAIGDIDGDGLPEILAVRDDLRGILAFESDGSFRWTSDSVTVPNHYSSIVLSDIDKDGYPEIIVGSIVLNSDGTAKRPKAGRTSGLGNSCVSDIDLDGSPEVIAGNAVYRADGSLFRKNQTCGCGDGFTAAADFDNDSYPEIVIAGNGRVCLLKHTGESVWEKSAVLNGGGGGPPVIADFDNDGKLEIGVAGRSEYAVFRSDGKLGWETATRDFSSGFTGSSVFDFEGDGSAEAVYADEEYLRIYRGTDGYELFKERVGSGTAAELPVIADVDNDNNAEIVVICNTYGGRKNKGIRVYGDANDTWVNTRKIWNQHSYHITNVNDDGTIPVNEENNWDTYNNYRQNAMIGANGCTDLSASYMRTEGGSMPNTPVTVTVRLGNCGVFDTMPGTDVTFYDGDPGAGGSPLGTVHSADRLEPGQYEDISFEWTDPPRGLHSIYAGADDGGTGKGSISESKETNNTAHVSVMLGNYAPVADAGPDRNPVFGTRADLNGGSSYDTDGDTLTFRWSLIGMPEGSSAALSDPASPTPFFTADRIGAYYVQLVVNDGFADSGADIAVITATAGGTHLDVKPVISGNAVAHQPLTFSVPGADTLTCLWDFGDGQSASGQEVSHFYTEPGTYTVLLKVSDSSGIVNPITLTVNIAPAQGPVASANIHGVFAAGDPLVFDGSASYSQDGGTIESYGWDFGDGGTGTGAETLHTYTNPGTYSVRLTVTDNGGLSASAELSLTVGGYILSNILTSHPL